MKNRKAVAFVLALSLVISSFSVSFATTVTKTASTNPVTFSDVTNHWGAAAIQKWAGYGIINGYEGLFRPDDSITRGEMAVILDNLMDYQEVAANAFTDLQAGQFYTDAVLKANAAGIIKGDGVTVRPADRITREEAAIMLSRAFAVAEASSTKAFRDASAVSDWAKDAVFGMEAKGYVSGYEGYFNPKANITRAEAVTMINNIVKAYYTAAGTYTEDVAGTAVVKVPDVTLKGVTVSENLIISEGVAQGDVTLESVTVKGETVIRGGGENSVHIKGNSAITKVTVEKIGDKLRVVIDDGITINNMEIAAGEEIIITGSVGTIELNASNVTVYANDAEIKTASITGDNCTIIAGAKTTLDKVTVSGTAEKAAIKTEAGSVVKAITASAEINVSGTGSVTNVTLNTGADGSTITTPNTVTKVDSGVTGVTGGGGTSIPAGSTGTNNSSGTTATVTTNTASSGSGSRSGGGSSSVAVTGITVSGTGGVSEVESGQTLQMVAAITPSNASNQTVTWSVTTEGGVATINSTTGLLTAITAGNATVTAVNAASGVSGSALITVIASKIQLTASAPTLTTSKAYDGTTAAAVTAGALSGVSGGDTVTLSAAAYYDTAAVGAGKTITVVYSISGADASKYIKPVNYTVITGEITKAALTIANPTLALSKAYDGTTAAAVTAGALSGVIGGETVNITAAAYYDTAAVGTGKTITVVYSISGTNSGNYTAPANYTTTSGIITSAPLGISSPTITALKTYDGTTSAAVTAGALSGVTGSDQVTVSAIAYYATKTVGTGKSITVEYTIGGPNADKYTAPNPYTTNSGIISAAPLTISDPALMLEKAYDGTTAAAVTAGALSGVIGGDSVTANAAAYYDSSAIGSGKTITVDYALAGADAGNYIKPAGFTTSAGIITKTALTISGTTFASVKPYDGTTAAAVTPGALSGAVGGETVAPVATAYFDSETVGSDKTITIDYTLTGANAGNYIAPESTTVSGIITPAELTAAGTAVNLEKTYDQTTSAAVTTGAITGIIGSEDVTVSAIAYYDSKTAGGPKTVTVKYTLSGTAKNNYTAPADYVTNSGIILPVQLTTSSAVDYAAVKSYDGTTSAAVTPGAINGILSGDDVIVSAIAYYDDAEVAAGKAIHIDYQLSGTDKDNYLKPASEVYYDGEITAAAITSVSVTCTPPAIDDTASPSTPTASVADGAHYIFSEISWSGYSGGTWAGGETPVAVITLSAATGYTFTDLLFGSITVSGGTASYESGQGVSADGSTVTFTVTYDMLVL